MDKRSIGPGLCHNVVAILWLISYSISKDVGWPTSFELTMMMLSLAIIFKHDDLKTSTSIEINADSYSVARSYPFTHATVFNRHMICRVYDLLTYNNVLIEEKKL